MVIGLTGGPATGKSLVTAEFERLGAAIIDADVIARQITQKDGPAHKDIRKEFGQGVILPDGSLDRRAIRRLIFADERKRIRLNGITHPLIRARIRAEIETLKKTSNIVVVAAPLLFETGLDKEMDAVIVVYADEKRQVERLMNRDALGEDEARRMVASQMPIKEKEKRADYIIDNNGGPDAAVKQAALLYEGLCEKPGKP